MFFVATWNVGHAVTPKLSFGQHWEWFEVEVEADIVCAVPRIVLVQCPNMSTFKYEARGTLAERENSGCVARTTR